MTDPADHVVKQKEVNRVALSVDGQRGICWDAVDAAQPVGNVPAALRSRETFTKDRLALPNR